MENPDNNICQDCGAEIWAFMVYDEIWAEAGLKEKDLLCQECTAKHLGRPLTHDDFTNCPANWHHVPGFFNDERGKAWLEDREDFYRKIAS